MTREQWMIAASMVFGVAVALVAMYAGDALVPVAMIGGILVALGWAFWVNGASDS